MDELDAKWETLIADLESQVGSVRWDETQMVSLSIKIGALHLVQPFNWREWAAPAPAREEIPQLSLDDCVRHITRVVRMNRVAEGVLASYAQSGDLLALCVQARKQAGGKPVPNVFASAN